MNKKVTERQWEQYLTLYAHVRSGGTIKTSGTWNSAAAALAAEDASSHLAPKGLAEFTQEMKAMLEEESKEE
jgi:hypothetical protein